MVKFKLEPKTLSLLSDARELGEARETLPVDYQGEEVSIGFNARYVLDFLNAIASESVRLELNDPLSPGLFLPHEATAEEEYFCVIMPMRV